MAAIGCSTMVSGTTQDVRLESNPSGAEVTRDFMVLGTTPITLPFKKSQFEPKLVFTKEGYKPQTIKLENRLDDYFWGNIVLGGVIGSTTDDATGAMYQFSPGQYLITLEPISTPGGFDRKTWLKNDQKAKEFIIIGYRQIITDINNGEGEYLSSLLNLLEIPEISQSAALTRLRYLAETSTDIPMFADRVIEDLGPRLSSSAPTTPPQNDGETDATVEKLRHEALKQEQ